MARRLILDTGVVIRAERGGAARLALPALALPFVIRAVQPVLLELDRDMEEAAASLGARPWTIFTRVILPNLLPAILSGAALAFALLRHGDGAIEAVQRRAGIEHADD